MKLRKSRLIFVLITQFAFLLILALGMRPNNPIGIDNAYLKSSDVHERIVIDGNWTETKTAGICSGSGTPEDPYVIRDIEIDGEGIGNCITIYNAYENFIIENCTIHGSGDGSVLDDAGLFIENVTNGIIHENSFSSNYYGIFIRDASNINVTFNNIGNVRGMKYLTNCSDMWLYLNTFTSSFYDLYFEDVDSITFNTPTQFLYEFHSQNYTNYLGNFWDEMVDEYRDDNNDGISEVPREYTGGTVDPTRYITEHYPLMEPHHNYLLIEPYFEPESKIPGYNLIVLIGIIALTSLFLFKRIKKE